MPVVNEAPNNFVPKKQKIQLTGSIWTLQYVILKHVGIFVQRYQNSTQTQKVLVHIIAVNSRIYSIKTAQTGTVETETEVKWHNTLHIGRLQNKQLQHRAFDVNSYA